MKKFISVALALLMLCSVSTFVFAAGVTTDSRLAVSGAQIRVPTGTNDPLEQGLRFISSMTSDAYALLDASEYPKSAADTGVGFGTVVFPTEILGSETLTKDTVINYNGRDFAAMVVPAVKLYTKSESMIEYTAVMIDISESNYETEYTAVPYITYTDDNNEEVTLYGNAYSTSVFKIAVSAYNDKKTTEYVKEYLLEHILSVVDPDKYESDGGWTPIYRP